MLYDVKWDKTVEVKLEPWRDILNKAADYIEEYGWCQRAMYAHVGDTRTPPPACMLGAIYVGGDHAFFDPYLAMKPCTPAVGDAIRAVQKFLNRSHLSAWNDSPKRTKDEVIGLLRLAAKVEQL